jgi:hypothetical protein
LQYYGSRYANVSLGTPPNKDFGKVYFSSGKFKSEFRRNPSNFEFRLCNTFDSAEECVLYETKVISKIYKRNNWINGNKNSFPVTDLSIPRKKSMLEKYGVEHNFQLKSVKHNKKLTWLCKYGVDNPTKSSVVLEKVKNTNLKKFGVDWAFQSPEVKNKIKNSCLEKYGTESPMKNRKIMDKVKSTNFKKYGVEYTFQSDGVIEKIHKKRKEMYLRFAKMTDDEFRLYLSTISQNPCIQSQKHSQRQKGINMLKMNEVVS